MTAEAYDAVIVGSGAGGGIAACVLAEAGLKVLVLEKGPWGTPAEWGNDELRFGSRTVIDEDPRIEPRTFRDSAAQGDHVYVGDVLDVSRCVGGGSVHYGAVSFRFRKEDFRALDTYGPLQGADLANWPLGDAELDPANPASIWACYDEVERLIGVAGGQPANATTPGAPMPGEQPNSARPYPMPGHPANYPAGLFEKAARSLGLHPFPTPVALNNGSYGGRPGCSYCGFCSGYACPIDAKGDTRVTALARALATGNCTLQAETYVRAIEVKRGRAEGVHYLSVGPAGKVSAGFARARVVVLAASTVDTPRLVLLSIRNGTLPAGLVNTDWVGTHLMVHHYPGAVGWFEERVDYWRGFWSMRCLDDFYFGPPNPLGHKSFGFGNVQTIGPSGGARQAFGTGGMISMAKTVGWGRFHKEVMAGVFGHLQFLSMIGQDPPVATNTVDLDPTVNDVYGEPVARITYAHHPNDTVVQAEMVPVLLGILEEMGARSAKPTAALVVPTTEPEGGTQALYQRGISQSSFHRGPLRALPDSIGGLVNHQMGTMRMGSDEGSSVVDPSGCFWGIPNLYVADGSVFPTSGGYNPTLTIQAMAWRTSRRIVDSGA